MKASEYNYMIPFGENVLFVNGITEAFFKVSRSNADAYKKIIDNPDTNRKIYGAFISRMMSQGFIIDDAVNEADVIRRKFESKRVGHQYYLMVLPTYQCNLRCWYCTQNHENLFMDDLTFEKIKSLVKRKLDNDKIKDFHLAWFGGEPLLAYDKLLELTVFARDLTKELGKSFSSSITTNGTLLNPERIESLREAGIGHYQITLDGDRKMHNSIKELGRISAYDRTLDNINLIARHTSVSLRFNYTKDNLRPGMIFRDLENKLNPEVRKNIAFTIFKVWQEDTSLSDSKDVDELFRKGVASGMYSTLYTSGVCYADYEHFDCIFPQGYVGKCDNHSPEEAPGVLQDDGTIVWREDMSEYYSPGLFSEKQKECNSCRYLPLCFGPCVSKRENMLRNKGVISCVYQNRERDMTRNIVNMVKTVLQKTSLDNKQQNISS
ncbi:MAG: radical SAM protein [Muribaculaceae bacterium]|nr:radical SAM protein [Muribaculaceae bacterium]